MSTELSIPGTQTVLKEGTVVMLERYPGTKWVVHNGWYTYSGRAFLGWYFSSIPAQECIPISQNDLKHITIISEGSGEIEPECPVKPDCPPFPPYPPYPPGPYPPCPPGPHPHPPQPAFISIAEKRRYEAAFISLPYLRSLDELNKDFIPDGKIVRVNNVEGSPKYFIWDKAEYTWSELIVVTDADIQEVKDLIAALDTRVTANEGSIADLQSSVSELSDSFDAYTQTTDQAIEDIRSRVSTVEETVSTLSTHVDELDTEVDGVQTKVLDLEASVTDMQQQIDALDDKVDELDASVGRWTVI